MTSQVKDSYLKMQFQNDELHNKKGNLSQFLTAHRLKQ